MSAKRIVFILISFCIGSRHKASARRTFGSDLRRATARLCVVFDESFHEFKGDAMLKKKGVGGCLTQSGLEA